jgi:hypothetical protein
VRAARNRRPIPRAGATSSTLNLSNGPGGIVTVGTQTDGETADESSTDTVSDSSNDSIEESQTDSDLEAADVSIDTINTSENDDDSDDETDTDTGSSGEQDTIVLGADMDELSGTILPVLTGASTWRLF